MARLGVPPLGAHDLALIQKHVRDLDGRREQAARVVAQVENQGFPAVVLELLESFPQLIGGVLVEARHADVADLLVLVDQEVPLIVGFAAVADHAREC